MRALFAGLILLAACQPQTPEIKTPGIVGGVDLASPVRALGTEPFWSVEITPSTLTYTDVEQNVRTAANAGVVVQGTTAVITSQTADGTPFVVTLITTECSDGMSDRTYPLTARVELGELTLSGCAASSAAITGGSEQGPVVEPVA